MARQQEAEPVFQLTQKGFGGGELGPQLLGRSEVQKYASGARLLRNFQIQRHGCAETRPGTIYQGAFKQNAYVRLVPFNFDATHSYVLEFGNIYCRVWKEGSLIVTTGAPAYSNATQYNGGEVVTYSGSVYIATAPNFGLAPGIGSWYLQAAGVMEFPTDCVQASLQTMQYVQPNATMTLASQGFLPWQITFVSEMQWYSRIMSFGASIAGPATVSATAGGPVANGNLPLNPTSVTATGGNASLNKSEYYITAWIAGSGQVEHSESPVSAQTLATVGGADSSNPVALAWTDPNPGAGITTSAFSIYKLFFPYFYKIADVGPSTLSLSDNGLGALSGNIQPRELSTTVITFNYLVTSISDATGEESVVGTPASCVGGPPTAANPNIIEFVTVAGCSSYNIYLEANGVFGLIGKAYGASTIIFLDTGLTPNTAIQPPVPLPISAIQPAVVSFFQSRLWFANTLANPNRMWGSQSGQPNNFNVLTPQVNNSACEFDILGDEPQTIVGIVDNGRMIIHTRTAEFLCSGDATGAITPTVLNPNRQGANGGSLIRPVVIPPTDIYVDVHQAQIRDLHFEIQSQGYAGADLTKYASGMFLDRTILEMAIQKVKNSILWCVMDDGELFGITYDRTEGLSAWHHHDTQGLYSALCVVPEGSASALYVSVLRGTSYMLERFTEREFEDVVYLSDFCGLDCASLYDGRNTTRSNIEVNTTVAGVWTQGTELVLTASGGGISGVVVGQAIVVYLLGQLVLGDTVYQNQVIAKMTVTITAITSPLGVIHLFGYADQAVPVSMQATLINTWGIASTVMSGLSYLNGLSVVALADGAVIPAQTVSGGEITLPDNALVVYVGLSYTCQLKTLPVENAQGDTLTSRPVSINEMTMMVYNSRGGRYGMDFEDLQDPPPNQQLGQGGSVYTGPVIIPVSSDWQATGQVCVEMDDPLPLGISAITPTGMAGN